MLGEVGAGISLSSGAGAGLAALGIGPQILAASLPVPEVAFAHFLAEYADFHPDVRGLIKAAPAATLIKWGCLFDRRSRRGGSPRVAAPW